MAVPVSGLSTSPISVGHKERSKYVQHPHGKPKYGSQVLDQADGEVLLGTVSAQSHASRVRRYGKRPRNQLVHDEIVATARRVPVLSPSLVSIAQQDRYI